MKTTSTNETTGNSRTFTIGGNLLVHRVGCGTMLITGKEICVGDLAKSGGALALAAVKLGAQPMPTHIALAWLLQQSPVTLPIPGTSKVAHVENNTEAALLKLDDSITEELEQTSFST
jgi:aryl-alcohol dehydrogenase-like predicted oxidoreductase